MKKIKQLLIEYVDDYIRKWNFSGVINVIKEDEVLLSTASGMACYEFEVPNTLHTKFGLASASKQFTAFAIMQLWDQGKLNLHNSANTYLPPNLAIDARISIHHLLSHTSGLAQFHNFEEDFFGEYHRHSYDQQSYFNLFISKPITFEVGSKFEYNNANYNVLAWIVEHISEQSFAVYLRDHVFRPLDMQNTCVESGSDVIRYKAFPYENEWNGVVKAQYSNEKFNIGAAGIVSNAADLYKWHTCLSQRTLLSDEAYELYFNENLSGYCYGLEKKKIYEQMCYVHGGDFIGVMTYILHSFEQDLSIIILSNNSLGNQYKIANSLCDLIFTGSTESPQTWQEVTLTEDEIAMYEGIYIHHKLELRYCEGRWSLVRFNGELCIPVIPVGNHQFLRIDYDQYTPYTLIPSEGGEMTLWGYSKK
jgi:CubicO group peptidase (beta-lactamase class C family)